MKSKFYSVFYLYEKINGGRNLSLITEKFWKCNYDEVPNVGVSIIDYMRGRMSSDKNKKYKVRVILHEINDDAYLKGDILNVKYNDKIAEALVVSNDIGNEYSPTLIVLPIVDDVLNLDEVSVISKERVLSKNNQFKGKIESVIYELRSKITTNIKDELNIVMVDFGETVGSEQNGFRPAVELIKNELSSIVIPITSLKKNKLYPTQIKIKSPLIGINDESTLLLEQIKCIDNSKVIANIGKLNYEYNLEIKNLIDKILFN